MRIYLAGKIGRNDWRHDIIPGLEDVETVPHDSRLGGHVLPSQWPILEKAIFSEHDYTGPFFMGGGHGLFHGRNSHGNGLYSDTYQTFFYAAETGVSDQPSDVSIPKEIIRLCLNAIQCSDVVYTWIDSTTPYGTLVELGFAIAHKKPIWWAQSKNMYDEIDDMWFARECAQGVYEADNATDGLLYFLDRFAPKITGYVYVLRSGNHYKIGKSKNVDRRVTQISPRTPLPVTHIHTIASDDMSWTETYLHQKYARYRTNGEWFELPQEEVAWLTTQQYIKRP